LSPRENDAEPIDDEATRLMRRRSPTTAAPAIRAILTGVSFRRGD
jgi:hypothetical protein